MSQFCVVTDTARGLKATIGGRALVPDVSLTDPELLTTMSPELTAHTGLDALSHAIESCVSEACDFLSRGHALAAARLVVEYLPIAVQEPSDLNAREAMARASLQAVSLGIPRGLRDVGVNPAVFDRFAANALGDAYIATNPRPVSQDDARQILLAAY